MASPFWSQLNEDTIKDLDQLTGSAVYYTLSEYITQAIF